MNRSNFHDFFKVKSLWGVTLGFFINISPKFLTRSISLILRRIFLISAKNFFKELLRPFSGVNSDFFFFMF